MGVDVRHDGGNEIGFGKINDVLIKTLLESNNEEKTPCDGGIFSILPTGTLVIGSVRNRAWNAAMSDSER